LVAFVSHIEKLNATRLCDENIDYFCTTVPCGFIIDWHLYNLMDKIVRSQPTFTKINMIDMASPTLLGDNCVHRWIKYLDKLGYERQLYDAMSKNDIPPNPFQILIDNKYTYLQGKILDDPNYINRPPQYCILLCLPFISQIANTGVTTTYRPWKQGQVMEDMNNSFDSKQHNNNNSIGHAQV
jgi:hypothetical protein